MLSGGVLINASGLKKSFGQTEALKDFSLSVRAGEIAGVVGPDGAGKTTAMRILSTVSVADSGSLTIDGENAFANYRAARRSIGYMSQKFGLYSDLSVSENIEFFAEIQDVPHKKIAPRMEILLKASGMFQFSTRLAGKLSGGMKQKLALCCALIHEPKALILDEPTNGVDPVSRREFWQILNRFASDGTAIVYATSYLDEAERCNFVNLMDKGTIIASGTPEELKHGLGADVIEIKGERARTLIGTIPQKFGKVWSFGSSLHIHSSKIDDGMLTQLRAAVGNDYEVYTVTPTLEDVFTYLTSRTVRDE